MKRILSRSMTMAAVAAIVTGGAMVAGAPAFAAQSDTASISPAAGGSTNAFSVITKSGCPTGSDSIVVELAGGPSTSLIGPTAGTPYYANGIAQLNAYGTSAGSTSPITIPISQVWDYYRSDNGFASIDPGQYVFTVRCIVGLTGAIKASYSATADVTTAMTKTAAGAWSFTAPVVKTDTTTTVSATPATAGFGDNVTLAAHVAANTGTGIPTGSVQFSADGTAIGAAATVNASGDATVTVNSLTVGSHSISAAYTATGNFNSSNSTTSAPVTVGAATTSTVLSFSPVPTYQTSTITLSAAVSKPGTVVFSGYTGGPSAAVTASGGVATLTIGSLAAGSYTVKATFTPTDPSFAGSSDTKTLTVGNVDPSQVATEYIDVNVPNGALTITVQGFTPPSPTTKVIGNPTNVVTLSAAQLDAAGQFITATGNIVPVQVVDTRAGDIGYKVTGSLTDFSGTAGKINGQNLGWTPKFISSTRFPLATTAASAGLTDGGTVAPANGVLPADAGTLGLKGVVTLYTAPAGASNGTVVYGAALALKAPTTTKPGDYEAVLTLTAN
jgi:hypothetical protein